MLTDFYLFGGRGVNYPFKSLLFSLSLSLTYSLSSSVSIMWFSPPPSYQFFFRLKSISIWSCVCCIWYHPDTQRSPTQADQDLILLPSSGHGEIMSKCCHYVVASMTVTARSVSMHLWFMVSFIACLFHIIWHFYLAYFPFIFIKIQQKFYYIKKEDLFKTWLLSHAPEELHFWK